MFKKYFESHTGLEQHEGESVITLKEMVLYSTKSGSLARNHRGTTLGAV